MTDIVERLRAEASRLNDDLGDGIWTRLMGESADEIERLRKTLREIEDSSNDPRAVREARAALGEPKP